MDVGRAFGFVFRDPRWGRTLLIASALLFVPIVGWLALAGYALRIVRLVAGGVDLPLPAWEDWGGLIGDGFKVFVVSFVWNLPAVVLNSAPRLGIGGESGAALAFGCLAFLLNIVVAVVTPAAIARLATTRSVGAGLDVGAVLSTVRGNFGDYLVLIAIGIGVGLLVAILFLIVFFAFVAGAIAATDSRGVILAALIVLPIGFVLIGPYLTLVFNHLYGQAYFRANRGPVLPASTSFGQPF